MKPAFSHVLPLAWVSMACLASMACVGNAPQSYFFPPPNNGVGQTVSKSLDSNGGTLQTASGAAALTIPAGALAQPTALTLTVKDKALSPNATQLMSQVFDFGPGGTQFARPVSMVLQASDAPATSQRATLAFLNPQGAWQVVPASTYNSTSQSVTGAVSHFTDYAIYLVDAQGAGCAASPDPNALCSPQICDMVHSLCAPVGTTPPDANTFSIGGSVAGLSGGTLVLNDNVNDPLALTSNGNFVFAQALADKAVYSVGIVQQPNNQFCVADNFYGHVAGANVTDVALRCVATYAIGGSVTGLLAGHTVTLKNGNDQVAVSAAAPNFVIDRALSGAAYAVTVSTDSVGQQCSLAGDTGMVAMADVNRVQVTCHTLSYPIGGQVQGLVDQTQVTLSNGNDTITTGNGNFAFPTPVLYGGNYAATLAAPAGQTCAFVGATSGVVGAAVSTLSVLCTPSAFTLGGRVGGLVGQTEVTIAQGNDALPFGNGAYTLPTPVAYGATYRITTSTTAGQACHFIDGNTFLTATMPASNVANANVSCIPATYSIGGTVTGLVGQGNVLLQNGNDSMSVYNGSYMFASSVAYGSTYAATLTSPAGENCNFTNAPSGTVGSANVTTLSVSCSPRVYTLGGTVSGLLNNTQVTLYNGADSLAVGNGAYTFATQVSYGAAYSASLMAPAGQNCVFSPTNANAGLMPAADMNQVNVVCTPQSYTLGGTVSGLMYNASLALQNGVDMLTVSGGSFTFPTQIAFTSDYNVTLQAPSGQACVFSGGTSNAGTMPAANITDISVTCALVPYAIRIAAPVSVVTGAPFSATLSILDVNANVLTGYTGTVQLSSSDAAGSPNASGQNVVFDSTDQGVVTVSGLQLVTLGQQMLVVNDAADQVQQEASIDVTSMFKATAGKHACAQFFSGAEPGEPPPVLGADAAARLQHAALWPPFGAPRLRGVRGRGVAASEAYFALQGMGSGDTPTSAAVDAFDTPSAMALDAASYLSYWVWPVVPEVHARQAAHSTYAGLHLLFDDGTDAAAPGLGLEPNVWNHVHVPLGAYAGKRVRRLAASWQQDGARGPFEVRFDAIHLVGHAACRR